MLIKSPNAIIKFIKNFHRDVEATTSVEYAIMLMVIVVLCINVIKVVGLDIADSYGNTADSINTAKSN